MREHGGSWWYISALVCLIDYEDLFDLRWNNARVLLCFAMSQLQTLSIIIVSMRSHSVLLWGAGRRRPEVSFDGFLPEEWGSMVLCMAKVFVSLIPGDWQRLMPQHVWSLDCLDSVDGAPEVESAQGSCGAILGVDVCVCGLFVHQDLPDFQAKASNI